MSDLVDRLVLDLARATGRPVATVRIAYGVASGAPLHECGDCGREWTSALAAAECCDDTYTTD